MPSDPANASSSAALEYSGDGVWQCRGSWTVPTIPSLERRLAETAWPETPRIVFNGGGLSGLDTAGAWLLHRLMTQLRDGGREVVLQGFRAEHRDLLALVASHVPTQAVAERHRETALEAVGRTSIAAFGDGFRFLSFVGEIVVVFSRLAVRPQRIRWRALFSNVMTAGYRALPIVGLLAFLLGVVIAYQGAVQLQLYGADIYVGDLVGLSMMRELSPLITAIIVAGRTGSAYTAQIGTMQVTEEVAAMRTIGLPPLELLVLPKLLALVIALPLLTVFADILGVMGGMVMAWAQLDLGFGVFLDRVAEAVSFSSYMVGIGKAPIFAAIIATVGCYQGFKVSGGAESVGSHTTTAVVQSIFLVIVTDALFSILLSWLGI